MILLDTHVLAWSVLDTKKLSRAATSAITRAQRGDGLAISAITLWELANLLARGRIRAVGAVEASVRQMIERVTIKAITPEIASLATQFPEDYSRDPADRLIGATARAEGLTLVTRDASMHRSPLLRTIW